MSELSLNNLNDNKLDVNGVTVNSQRANYLTVRTVVPADALFTDTVTSINGKTGAIVKTDILALGINDITTSLTNGNIKVNETETTIYTHPSTHPANMIVTDPNHKFVTEIDIANWNVSAMIGTILSWRGNWIPVGWTLCDGKLLSITQYPDLFSLFGTIYGGDGITTFALPKLCGQMPTIIDAVAQVTSIEIITGCTSDGLITINLNGASYNINVLNTDTTNGMALKLQVFIDALPDYIATVNSNVVTITAINSRFELGTTFDGNDTGVTGDVSLITRGVNQMTLINDNKIVNRIIAIQGVSPVHP